MKTKGIILVTGCSGLVGTHLCNKLETKGYSVVGVDIKYSPALPESDTFLFQDIVKQELEIHGCRIGRIIRGPIDSLVGYHKSKNRPLSAVS